MPLAAERMESKTFFCRSFRRAASSRGCLMSDWKECPMSKRTAGTKDDKEVIQIEVPLLERVSKYLKI